MSIKETSQTNDASAGKRLDENLSKDLGKNLGKDSDSVIKAPPKNMAFGAFLNEPKPPKRHESNDTSMHKSGAKAEAQSQNEPLLVDDDLTVIMNVIKTPTPNCVPEQHQGTRRGNLVAYRTGNTDTQIPII